MRLTETGREDWTALAAAVLAEVGLTFDDVLDVGRDWLIGPPGFETEIAAPSWRGAVYTFDRCNPTSRQRHLIALTGPVDCVEMFQILAHECGHIACRAWTSIPEYEHEYSAERYSFAAAERHGVVLPPGIMKRAKDYVLGHCVGRYYAVGPQPLKGWRRDIVEWCGFNEWLADKGFDPDELYR